MVIHFKNRTSQIIEKARVLAVFKFDSAIKINVLKFGEKNYNDADGS